MSDKNNFDDMAVKQEEDGTIVGTHAKKKGAKEIVSMNMNATVENKPQLLSKVRPFPAACLQIPPGMKEEGVMVLQAMFNCFEKQGEVKEGLIGDLVWGFSQTGIPPELTVNGLNHLQKKGFIKFQAIDNEYVELSSDKSSGAWVRYQKPLLDIAYEPE